MLYLKQIPVIKVKLIIEIIWYEYSRNYRISRTYTTMGIRVLMRENYTNELFRVMMLILGGFGPF